MIRVAQAVTVSDPSGVAVARREAMQCAHAIGLDEVRAGRAALIATELATNQLKHGVSGSILFATDENHPHSLYLVAADRGRGIGSIDQAMSDGYSTAGSAGTGLGAIQRAATEFDLYSLPDKGTIVYVAIDGAAAAAARRPRFAVAGICLPKPGEDQPGDDWVASLVDDELTVTIADGLGHGPAAAEAANAAVRVFRRREGLGIPELLREMHGELRPTRGAAVGIVRVKAGESRAEFGGVGNIAAAAAEGDALRKMVSQNGIVGHEMRKVQTFSYPWSAHSTLIMHSDGIGTAWNLAQYPGLAHRNALMIAAMIYRDFCRGTDDATVVVAKQLDGS